jgi:hypothetical protein
MREILFILITNKPAFFENSLSNKEQLSAWKHTEVADLMAIVERVYRQGSGMLLVDPLSRVCAPTEGWYDPTLPRKLAALLSHLTAEVKSNENIRVYILSSGYYCSSKDCSEVENPQEQSGPGEAHTRNQEWRFPSRNTYGKQRH